MYISSTKFNFNILTLFIFVKTDQIMLIRIQNKPILYLNNKFVLIQTEIINLRSNGYFVPLRVED